MHSYLPASDVTRARAFYEKMLSFRPLAVAELKARGLTFEGYDGPGMKTVNGIATAGGAKTAWFKDTEGNILAIVQDVR